MSSALLPALPAAPPRPLAARSGAARAGTAGLPAVPHAWPHAWLLVAALAAGAAAAQNTASAPGAAARAGLAAVAARAGGSGALAAYDGVVEALRQTVVAAQVSGAVVQLDVKVGDRVQAGQLLLRLDARAADQSAAASEAQLRAARAAQEVAEREVARQRQLAAERFISGAALDRAEAEYKVASAQAAALLAQAGAARTQSGFYAVRAPYAGVVSELPVTLGDMALPGRPLLTLYDPAALRVSAAVPQSAVAALGDGRAVRVELPALPAAERMLAPQRVHQLPAADVATHTVTLRAELPAAAVPGLAPGQFARLWLPAGGGSAATAGVWVPVQAVVRRGEMTGLYVLDGAGRPLLRQVRLGRSDGAQVEVLSGLRAGERVATDVPAATRLTVAQQ
jgi:RND family efflux transporter MFP subunit